MALENFATSQLFAASNAASKDADSMKLFVGQIPRQLSEAEIRPYFEAYGPVYELVILRDRLNPTQSKGCAFLTFCKRNDATRCMSELHGTSPLPGQTGHTLQIKVADNDSKPEERKLFVGMLPRDFTEAQIQAMFGAFGTLEECAVLKDATGVSKGCAFLKFETSSSAKNAITAMHNSRTFEGCRSAIVVKFADTDKDKASKQRPAFAGNFGGFGGNPFTPFGMPPQMAQAPMGYPNQMGMQGPPPSFDPANPYAAAWAAYGAQQAAVMNPYMAMGSAPALYGGAASHAASLAQSAMAQKQKDGPDGANLFIYHLPQEFDDNSLMAMFAPFGPLLSAKVFVDKNTGQSKCFGFASYDNAPSAAKAIQVMNGYMIGAKRLKVELKRARGANSSFAPY